MGKNDILWRRVSFDKIIIYQQCMLSKTVSVTVKCEVKLPIIWVLESPHENGMVLSRALIGNFAIRCVASIPSFTRICRIDKDRAPDIVVINCEHFSEAIEELDRQIAKTVSGASRIFLCHQKEKVTSLGPATTSCSREMIHDGLVGHVKTIVQRRMEESLKNILNYKDIDIDLHEFTMRIQPSEVFESLPNREFRLVRLFLNNPKKCFSRDELKQLVWDGTAVAARTIDSQISRLRKRLSHSEATIESIYGGGYKLT